ncbi:NUDIX hydrolase [Cellulosimicrobium sp. NPDC057127]|uniref:NUDIX hydrolase n=1 Tax=Cellulosimicrobium sp. NPDC057127 TaxID=3346026 RepID=UPI0036441B51
MTYALLAADALDRLARWRPADPAQAALAVDYAAFLRDGPDIDSTDADADAEADDGAAPARAGAVARDAGPEHLTGSCFVLSPELDRVLLCYHRKGRFWVQVGGHLEPGDTTLPGAALREAREESGIADLRPFEPEAWALPVDVHRHELAAAFGRCRAHRDVGFVAFADPSAPTAVSDESEDVAWFPVHDLPPGTPPDFPQRLATVLAEVRHRRRAADDGRATRTAAGPAAGAHPSGG